jgi:hypothetical protein
VALPTNLVTSLLQLGIVGALLIDVFATHKFVMPHWVLDRAEEAHTKEMSLKDDLIEGLQADVKELKAANAELQQLTIKEMIPALVSATDVSRAYVAELARRNSETRHPEGN